MCGCEITCSRSLQTQVAPGIAAADGAAAAVLDDLHEPRHDLLAAGPRRDVGVDAGRYELLNRCWALCRHAHVPQLAPHRVPPVADRGVVPQVYPMAMVPGQFMSPCS